MGGHRLFLGIALTLGLWVTGWVQAAQVAQLAQPYTELKQARMKGLGLEKTVSLPHMMAPADFEPEGSLVSYTMLLDLATLPEKPLGIYVPKMSLSGNVYLNGQLFGACERGQLKEVRCLHRPYLYTIPTSFWRLGQNELRFEIYANGRQSNGLSSVRVGDIHALETKFYRWRHWLQVDLVTGLTWLSGLLGVMALVVAVVLRKGSVHLWFGLTSIVNAVANTSVFMSRPPIDSELFSWIAFASRFASGHLLILMFASFFDKLTPRIQWGVLAYTVLSVALIGLSGNNRLWVTVLYMPLLLTVICMPALLFYWTWKTRQVKHIFASTMMGLITVASSFDWLRFTGDSGFVGMYFIPYSYSGVLFMFGGMLLALLAFALIRSQNQSAELELRVAERTDELNALHDRLLNTEIDRSRTQERQHMLQDMHDGFGSQLVIAKMMVEQNQMSQESLGRLLEESIGDLYLLVDTLGNSDNYLPNALVDFRFRTQQRLAGTPLKLHWNLQVEHAPEVSPKVVLQILRLLQEALNNALKHAKATNIHLDFTYDQVGGQLTVSVADDGVGIVGIVGIVGQPVRGRGQKNMMARARAVGGTLSVSSSNLSFSSSQPGTLVQLLVPLPH
jgi:signal transduction histidine kinase